MRTLSPTLKTVHPHFARESQKTAAFRSSGSRQAEPTQWLLEGLAEFDSREFCRRRPFSGYLLPGRGLDSGGSNPGTRPTGSFQEVAGSDQGHLCLSTGKRRSRPVGSGGGTGAGAPLGPAEGVDDRELGEAGVWRRAVKGGALKGTARGDCRFGRGEVNRIRY